MADVPRGFETPIFQCLLRKRLLLGAPRTVTVLLLASAGVAFIWGFWPAFPVLGVLHGAAVVGTWIDEDWFEIGVRWLYTKRHYEA
jgi:type IV secretory pathway VirB3-like protein